MLLLSEFYLHCFRLEVLLPMDTHTSSRRALKPAQEQEVDEDWRWPRNETELGRAAETLEQRSEKAKGELGSLLKLVVKDKLLHSEKVPVNAELRPLRKEKRGTKVQQYATLNEAMKI